DQNTAMWSLQMRSGIGEIRAFTYDGDREVYFRVVGLLAGSVLQGSLLVGERNFLTVFPDEAGYSFFLFEVNPTSDATDSLSKISSVLESRLSDAGMDVAETDRVLASLLAVQNTYLRTFQSLGALGLLLGTVGLAIAQLRNVLQRRGELAVMRAMGFTPQRLAGLLMRENVVLLSLGIGCGSVTAIISVLPPLLRRSGSVSVGEPMMILAGIFLFGVLAGLIAVVRVATLPLIESLRSEDAVVEI
ncbi:MAG: ABC transporter permease, partial [Planctomycetota bacterium]